MHNTKIIPFSGEESIQGVPGLASMNSELVEEASQKIESIPLLINMVSKRVRQLNMGRPPLIRLTGSLSASDIALQEIIEGKISASLPEGAGDEAGE